MADNNGATVRRILKPAVKEEVSDGKKRVAAYCRVSTKSEGQETSYDTQVAVYTQRINNEPDWELAGIYADWGMSGTQAQHRPKFLKMVADCEDGKIDIILCKSMSRFSRNTLDADRVLVLTPKDKKRLIELYGNRGNMELMPVCVKRFDPGKRENLPEPYIAITGSLWFGPNADGTKWFLKEVWSRLDDSVTNKYALVIAGANPNEEIKQLGKQLNNVHIYDSPNDIDAYYQQAILYVAPIFYGAGMKVKIAEALSCGLPVITTKHSSAGYEAVNEYINICDTADGFIKKIIEILRMSDENREKIRREIVEAYENKYSLDQAEKIMNRVIDEVIKR